MRESGSPTVPGLLSPENNGGSGADPTENGKDLVLLPAGFGSGTWVKEQIDQFLTSS